MGRSPRIESPDAVYHVLCRDDKCEAISKAVLCPRITLIHADYGIQNRSGFLNFKWFSGIAESAIIGEIRGSFSR